MIGACTAADNGELNSPHNVLDGDQKTRYRLGGATVCVCVFNLTRTITLNYLFVCTVCVRVKVPPIELFPVVELRCARVQCFRIVVVHCSTVYYYIYIYLKVCVCVCVRTSDKSI